MTSGSLRSRPVPRLNWANLFTFLRVALVPLFAWLLVVREPAAPTVAAIVFAAAAATDGLDGFVARRLDLVSGFGQTLDPIADKLLVGTALVALAIDERIPWWAVTLILAREFFVGVVMRLYFARTRRALPASRMAKFKTGSQILAVLLLTILAPGSEWALTVLYAAVGLTALSGFLYVSDATRGRAGVDWQ